MTDLCCDLWYVCYMSSWEQVSFRMQWSITWILLWCRPCPTSVVSWGSAKCQRFRQGPPGESKTWEANKGWALQLQFRGIRNVTLEMGFKKYICNVQRHHVIYLLSRQPKLLDVQTLCICSPCRWPGLFNDWAIEHALVYGKQMPVAAAHAPCNTTSTL